MRIQPPVVGALLPIRRESFLPSERIGDDTVRVCCAEVATMAEFAKYSMRFESSQASTADRKQVGSPPGHEPSAGRDLVRAAAAPASVQLGCAFIIAMHV